MNAEAAVREGNVADRPAISALQRSVFGEQGDTIAALLEMLWASDHFVTEHVVETEDVVGHVALSRCWVDARAELVDAWLLSPLGVDDQHRGDGLGADLVDAAVGAARAAGVPFVVIEGDPGYYGKLGFMPASTFELAPPSRRVPSAAFQARLTHASGAGLGPAQVIYPELWWRLDLVGLRDPVLAEVEKRLT